MIQNFLSLAFAVCALGAWSQVKVENLVFEGAGIRGIAYCGALMELDERGILDGVERVAGTSSGAITASLLAVGYEPQEIYSIIGSTDFSRFNDGRGAFIGGMYRMNARLGWYRGATFLRWLEQLIAARAGSADVTFAQLREMAATGAFRELVVTATSLNHQESIFFSAETFPAMRIVDAVRASMAVPLYFEPVIIDARGNVVDKKEMLPEHHVCVDGGFTVNFPVAVFDLPGGVPAATLGLRIDSDAQIRNDQGSRELMYMPVGNAKEFVGAFYYLVKENMNRVHLTEADWQRTVSISDAEIGPKVRRLSDGEKALLIEAGRSGVRNYFAAP